VFLSSGTDSSWLPVLCKSKVGIGLKLLLLVLMRNLLIMKLLMQKNSGNFANRSYGALRSLKEMLDIVPSLPEIYDDRC